MAKRVPDHLRDGAAKCLFCGEPGLSKTHIWPNWLNKLLSPPSARHEVIERPSHHQRPGTEQKIRQGSIFSQKPYLACEKCNTGWMKAFEDEVEKFGHLFLTSPDSTLLEEGQVRSLAGWVTLITILAQYIDRARIDITVTRHDLDCIWQRKVPPDHWSIFAASLDGFLWRARYRHRATNISPYAGVQEYLDAVTAGVQANTMVSSFGIGSIYFQVFGCPVPSFVSDYRAVTKQAGLNQLWPLPAGSLWPYAKQGTAKFPTKLVLTDATADELSNTYYERIRRLTKLSI
jgi:hypothetical protein